MPLKKTALLILGDGAEEIEAVISIAIMRRAGMDVTVASMNSTRNVKCSDGTNIQADASLKESYSNLYDAVVLTGGILPGGVMRGSKELSDSGDVRAALINHHQIGYLIAAIGTGPEVLAAQEIAKGKRVTCDTSVRHKMRDYTYTGQNMIQDGNILTSIGGANAFQFALEIVSNLHGRGTAERVRKEMYIA